MATNKRAAEKQQLYRDRQRIMAVKCAVQNLQEVDDLEKFLADSPLSMSDLFYLAGL